LLRLLVLKYYMLVKKNSLVNATTRTVSIASASAAAFFFSLALTLAVVERTAVAALAKVSRLGGVAGGG
jgi:hypothetical protein